MRWRLLCGIPDLRKLPLYRIRLPPPEYCRDNGSTGGTGNKTFYRAALSNVVGVICHTAHLHPHFRQVGQGRHGFRCGGSRAFRRIDQRPDRGLCRRISTVSGLRLKPLACVLHKIKQVFHARLALQFHLLEFVANKL